MHSQIAEHYTYEDYKQWEGDWELIDGIPFAMAPAPMIKHQNILVKIASFMNNILDEKECEKCIVASEVDWKISNDTVLKPDIVLICDEDEFEKAYLTKSPQIVIEIISKSTAKRDEKYKFEIYEEEKVKYYILVYPDDLKAKIYKLKNGKFEKEGDFTTEKYIFKNLKCEMEIDFNKIFKRYRKK